MVSDRELRILIESARACGAIIRTKIDRSDVITAVQVRKGIAGVGAGWMPPIHAAERLGLFLGLHGDSEPEWVGGRLDAPSASKHAPGPWAYHKWDGPSGTSFGIETADHRHGLASITPNVNASTLLTMEQHEANARLLAAAPELLDACERLVKWHPSDCLHDPANMECELCFAAAVIAKAKGGA